MKEGGMDERGMDEGRRNEGEVDSMKNRLEGLFMNCEMNKQLNNQK